MVAKHSEAKGSRVKADEAGIGAQLTCAKCGGSFDRPSGTGRPPTYCGELCKRLVEYEVRRIDRRLGRYELEHRELKAKGVQDYDDEERERQRRLRALRGWIRTDEERLRKLLAGSVKATGAGKAGPGDQGQPQESTPC